MMREMVEIFPFKLRKLWNDLELRILVLISLSLQIVLIATGNRRKYRRNKWIAAILWLCYLSADAVATLALGVLSQSQGDTESLQSPSYEIMAFWAPFLLMHLGGPDTITAYSLADNELWGRHLLGLLSQVGVAFFVVFLRSWIGSPINYLWIVIFIAGLVKYGERTLALFLASRDQFRESLVSRPDPGPNYAKFMDELISREAEGYKVSHEKAINIVSLSSTQVVPAANVADTGEGRNPDVTILHDAYYFFGTFKRLFADLILSFQDRETSLSFFNNVDVSWDKAFGIVEVELGLMYDLFYTKAFILYSPHGWFLRVLSCSATIGAFVGFLVIDKDKGAETDVTITYILLVGAILLEIYAILILVSSDRTMIWLSEEWAVIPGLRRFMPQLRKLKNFIVLVIYKIVSYLQKLHLIPSKKRWSNAMGQYNVLNYCLESKPKCTNLHQFLDKYLLSKSISIPKGLKALIFKELRKRVARKQLGNYRGDIVLLEEMNFFKKSSDKVEFDQSILLWHVATDFCYHKDVVNEEQDRKSWLDEFILEENSPSEDKLKFRCEISRFLSNYMIYLLIMCPFMLPSGIGQIRFQDTCAEVTQFFDGQKLSKKNACEMVCKVDTRIPPSQVKGDRSKSLLFDGCILVESLQELEVEQRWEKISQAWLDILTFAAAQCRWTDHAEKLSQGGELLTHVWLLMAHFGMTDQFQISEGYMRMKLQVK